MSQLQGISPSNARSPANFKKTTSNAGSVDVKKLAALNSLETFSPKLLYLGSKKEKSVPHFRGNKVSTCSYVTVQGIHPVAVPFYKHPSKPVAEQVSKSTYLSSLSHDQFKVYPNMHAGMKTKPLVRYHPDSYRNRLPTVDNPMPSKNASSIIIGDRSYKDPNHYKSLSQECYKNVSSLDFVPINE